jgi:peptidoglycan/LPS O-acetylase OafA/YrhL
MGYELEASGSAATAPSPIEPATTSPDAARATTTTSKPFTLGNRPALTGIRALLMVPVVLYHASLTAMRGAWMPLEVFFVLSGFLITTMLASEHQRRGTISLGKFYSRRAVRLLPPLVMTIALLGLYAWLVHVDDASQRVWGDSAAALFYSDYRQAFEHDPLYSGFLTQCWSLAVEEQFYLIWAALLVVSLKFGKRQVAYGLAITGIVLSAVDRVHIVLAAPQWTLAVGDRTYYAFDTRADALFFGCLLGLIATGGHLEDWGPRAKRVLVVVALASTAIMLWILFNVSVGARSLPLYWIPVAELASVVFIVYFIVHPKGVGTRLIGISALVLIGDMTYTIYLVHYPIFVAVSPATVGWPFWLIEVVRIALVIPLVVASWYLVEKPLMQWRRRALTPTPTNPQPVAD